MAARPGVEGELAYYTVANAAHYPGAVALLNSLRLLGEVAPVFVVDCGLTGRQRGMLSRHVTLVPRQGALPPGLQKATGPLAHPAEIMVLLDADVIVTRLLTPLFEDASRGRIVAFENDHDRFFPEWSSLGLGVPKRRSYVNSGHLVVSSDTASEFLPLFGELQKHLDVSRTCFGREGDPSNPFYFADQDILNAVLCTRYDGLAARIEHRFAPVPPFPGLKVVDLTRLECAYDDGTEPYLLHHILRKPWLGATKASPYTALFTRLVTGGDVVLRLDAHDIPLRLRDSSFAAIGRAGAAVQVEARARLRGKLGIRPALEHRLREASRRARGRVAGQ